MNSVVKTDEMPLSILFNGLKSNGIIVLIIVIMILNFGSRPPSSGTGLFDQTNPSILLVFILATRKERMASQSPQKLEEMQLKILLTASYKYQLKHRQTDNCVYILNYLNSSFHIFIVRYVLCSRHLNITAFY